MKEESTDNDYPISSLPVGIRSYKNPWHSRNCYLELGLEHYDSEVAKETIASIRRSIKAPLQIMLPSDESVKIQFILAAGFQLKRSCVELLVSRQDLKKPLPDKTLPILDPKDADPQRSHGQLPSGLHMISRGKPAYEEAAKIVHEHYRSTHESINPLTVGVEACCAKLPDHVIIDFVKGSFRHMAFVEANEIAYVASIEPEEFSSFADKLLSDLFAFYQEIAFEADDLDPVATALRLKFHCDGKVSFNTYIYSD